MVGVTTREGRLPGCAVESAAWRGYVAPAGEAARTTLCRRTTAPLDWCGRTSVPLGVPADGDRSEADTQNRPGSTLRRPLRASLTVVIGRLRPGWPQAWVSSLRLFVLTRKARAQR
jgi:hypothetical protein